VAGADLVWEKNTATCCQQKTEVHVPCEACLMIIAWPFSLFLMLTNWPCLIHSWPFLCFMANYLLCPLLLWYILHETNLVSSFKETILILLTSSFPRLTYTGLQDHTPKQVPVQVETICRVSLFQVSNKVACRDWPCQKRHQRHKLWQVRHEWGIYVWCVHSEVWLTSRAIIYRSWIRINLILDQMFVGHKTILWLDPFYCY